MNIFGKRIKAFGKRVIGEARAAIEQQMDVEKRTRFGPRVLGSKVVPGTNTPAPDSEPVASAAGATQAKETLSVATLADMLAKNPKYIDHYIELEKARPGGPRRKAVKIMLASERKNARRDAVIKMLQRMDPGDTEFPEALTNRELAEHHQEAGQAAGPLKDVSEVLKGAAADAE